MSADDPPVEADASKEFDPLDYHVIADTVVSALLRRPLEALPISESFTGAGVYVIYYNGEFEAYAPLRNTETPIYVGKAIPAGSRRASSALRQIERIKSPALWNRLRDHASSIDSATNLSLSDFRCRYLVVTPIWIGIAESLLIEGFRPLWNAVVDGFGLHHPGKTRFAQRRSDWDTLHPGRAWAPKMKKGKDVGDILDAIASHFS